METIKQEGWLLNDCPPEIRLMILKGALQSRNGRFIFRCLERDHRRGYLVEDDSQWHDSESGYSDQRLYISRNDTFVGALQRTCRQIYAETAELLDLIWERNTMVIDLDHMASLVRDCPIYMWILRNQIVHIQINIEGESQGEHQNLLEALEIVQNLSPRGTLKSITFCLARGLMNLLRLGERVGNEFSLNGLADAFRTLEQKFSYTQVKLKIVIETGWHSLSTHSQVYFRRSTERDFLTLERRQHCVHKFDRILEVLWKLHEALKGELWQDGTLCYKDREVLCEPFKLPPNADEEVTMIDRKMFRDAIYRRGIYQAPSKLNYREPDDLPADLRTHLYKGKEYLRQLDVTHISIPRSVVVNIFPNWHDYDDPLTDFVSRDHPIFFLRWKERCLNRSPPSCPEECRCNKCVPVAGKCWRTERCIRWTS